HGEPTRHATMRRVEARRRRPHGGERRRRSRLLRWRPQSFATCLASVDFRFAAWLLWMTPLLAALSNLREAVLSASLAASLSPATIASRTRRTCVFNSDLTALLRSRAFSFVRLRLIWDLMFATC